MSPSPPSPRALEPTGELGINALATYVERAAHDIAETTDLPSLDAVAASIRGREAPLGTWKKSLGSVDPAERPRLGAALNDALSRLEASIEAHRDLLSVDARAIALTAHRLDLTEVTAELRPGHRHVLTKVREELEDVFLGMGFEVVDGPEAETEWYNFSALNMPRDHPARSIQDSFYLDLGDRESKLLRSQTSPAQICLLQRGELPIYAVSPGRVYRRDTADASHLPVFHQIEGLVVDEKVTFGDLAGTIDLFVRGIFGAAVESRLRPGYFPFTEPSAEFDITSAICHGEGCRTCAQTGWVELGGCGMVHPAVFEATGVDTERWTGFAFGFGIERLAMMRHGIEDIRTLIENDVRFLTQFSS